MCGVNGWGRSPEPHLQRVYHRETVLQPPQMADAQPQVCLVLLCGLPAAGKTTICRQLMSGSGTARLRSELAVPALRLWHLSFDAVQRILEAEAGAEGFDPALWHAARERALAAVHAHIAAEKVVAAGAAAAEAEPTVPPPPLLSAVAACTSSVSPDAAVGARPVDVLLLDDNMYYRSMRRPFYQLAREHGLGMCVVCLRIDLAAAVARDACRQGADRVGAPTIHLMAEALQWPLAAERSASWEATACLSLDAASPAGGGGGGGGDGGGDGEAPPLSDAEWSDLARLLSRPVPPASLSAEAEQTRAAEAAASAAATAESATHQLDLRLRKLTSTFMRSADANALPPARRAELARLFSEKKREALLAVKRSRRETSAQPGGEVEEAAAFEALADGLELEFALLLRHRRVETDGDGARDTR